MDLSVSFIVLLVSIVVFGELTAGDELSVVGELFPGRWLWELGANNVESLGVIVLRFLIHAGQVIGKLDSVEIYINNFEPLSPHPFV